MLQNVKSWFANRRTKEKRNSSAFEAPADQTPNTTTSTTSNTQIQTPITTNTTTTTTNTLNTNNTTNTPKSDDLSDLPSVISSAGVPGSHQPILETDINKLHARIKELEAENFHLKQQLYVLFIIYLILFCCICL